MMRPIADRVVVVPDAAEAKTAGGLHLPESAQAKPLSGEVIAVGRGRVDSTGCIVEPELAVGDKVLFSRYTGTEHEIEGRKVMILREDDVLVILDRPSEVRS